MIHSIDTGLSPFMNQTFYDNAQTLVQKRGHRFTADLLKIMGVSFENAYELIFNRKPRL